MIDPVLLVGAGFMAEAYANVLGALNQPFIVVGHSPDGVERFRQRTNVRAHAGGVEEWLHRAQTLPHTAIVCVSVEQAAATTQALIHSGARRVLLEKPGGMNSCELSALASAADQARADVVIAYNRRFYASVLEAERRIAAEGGITSTHFDFTERESDALARKFSQHVRSHWALHNSSHVIDLAFFLSGEPTRLHSEVCGHLEWHPAGAQFVGSGLTTKGIPFSYHADWSSGGRWGVELMTRRSKLILRPLEQLHVQVKGSFDVQRVEIDDDLDTRYKPGVYRQTAAFLNGDFSRFVPVFDQARRAATFFPSISGE